ncbi:MAG TPA: bifunctional phosphoribosylaminoimidazolecarboxamide formyltransferase/IMP cyclohydrolase [Candidatus Cloacimonadota bacterium]|nr:bifunctional phosphoribosylaminoimidazolecarboxamide formyltransferase/IMP cyclohydrolase [Candidatus Cloacimonadota bacterium]HPT71354.1 bifunctional phosphoribosylaminoimidazolecarboxamide formyltransferase/IMP cyclohydrolase [Candidatus Cloacimonadota bacterium]
MTKNTNRKALISVSDKTGIFDLATALYKMDFEIISTGGTAKLLRENGIPVTLVSDLTGFPEIMDGRVKTLHPLIHGGILADRDEKAHMKKAEELNIPMIDIVVVNLYPFKQTLLKEDVTLPEIIENIDIGGPSLIRAAAKNFKYVSILTDPNDFFAFIDQYYLNGEPTFEFRKYLAGKAFAHTADYDTAIATYFKQDEILPELIQVSLPKHDKLRYGENPHQQGAYYLDPAHACIKVLHGKTPSYNNYLDMDAALKLITNFKNPTTAILKHTNPCGIGSDKSLLQSYIKAFETDTSSPYGGIVVVNRSLDMETAEKINEIFTEIILAPDFPKPVLEKLMKKKDRRLVQYDMRKVMQLKEQRALQSCLGGLLVQQIDLGRDNNTEWKVVTKRHPLENETSAMIYGWKVVSMLKSNAIAFTTNERTFGMGTGQMSRIDSLEIAAKKAKEYGHNLKKSICASDGFFPFRDSIEALHKLGVKAVIQPGGSKSDEEVIKACDEFGITMIFTGMRHFRH